MSPAGRRAGLVTVLGATVALVTVLQTAWGAPVLSAVGIASTPPAFLELSFAEPGTHPDRVASGQSVPVAFVLRGNGAAFPEVAWRVETGAGAAAQTSAHGTVAVPDGAERPVATTARITCPGSTDARVPVRVSVAAPSESILFWVTCTPGAP